MSESAKQEQYRRVVVNDLAGNVREMAVGELAGEAQPLDLTDEERLGLPPLNPADDDTDPVAVTVDPDGTVTEGEPVEEGAADEDDEP